MSHRQEEQVEGVELASARCEASLQDIDGFGVLTRTIQRHAEGVEIDRLIGCQRDGLPGQENGSLGVALHEGAGHQAPGQIVQQVRTLGQQRAGFLPVEPRRLVLAEGLVGRAAELVQHEVLRVSADQGVEVGQGLAVPAQPVQRPRAVVAGQDRASGRRREPGRNRPRPVA